MNTGSQEWQSQQPDPEERASAGEDGAPPPAASGPIVPPADWSAPVPGATEQTPGAVPPPTPAPHAGSHGEQTPSLEGVTFDRATEHNTRAIIGMVLSGLGLAGVLAWFAGFSTPLLLVVILGIGGIVMGLRGRAAAANGLATNGMLGIAAAIVGVLALLGVVGIYALVIAAVSQLTA